MNCGLITPPSAFKPKCRAMSVASKTRVETEGTVRAKNLRFDNSEVTALLETIGNLVGKQLEDLRIGKGSHLSSLAMELTAVATAEHPGPRTSDGRADRDRPRSASASPTSHLEPTK